MFFCISVPEHQTEFWGAKGSFLLLKNSGKRSWT